MAALLAGGVSWLIGNRISWPGADAASRSPRFVLAARGGPRLLTVPAVPLVPALQPPVVADEHLRRYYDHIVAAQLPSGAIALTPQRLHINPYFANLAASALTTEGHYLPYVRRYLDWYVEHLNGPGRGGIDGTIDDYNLRNGREVPTGDYDSADSYGATFLALVADYLQATDDIDWVQQNLPALERVAGNILRLTDSDGLTWAKAGYPLKLLMDNSEVFTGWSRWSEVLTRLGHLEAASAARRYSVATQEAIQRFVQPDGNYSWGLGPLGWRQRSFPERRFYPDAVAQYFPLMQGVTSSPAGFLRFDTSHPRWPDLVDDTFPWLASACAARHAGLPAAGHQALVTADRQFPALTFPWTVAESAWAIRTAALSSAACGG